MIIVCPCCSAAYNESDATKYPEKSIFTNKKARPSTWEYLLQLEEAEEEQQAV